MSGTKTEKLRDGTTRETTTHNDGSQKINTYREGNFSRTLVSSERRDPPKKR